MLNKNRGQKTVKTHGLWSSFAFTLIEIMITTAVLALLITGIYSIFKGGTDSWTKGNVRMERYQNARAILEMMSREISCAMVNEARKIYMLGINDDGTQIKTGSTKDELFFIAPLYPASDMQTYNKCDLLEIGYWIKADTEIMRHYVTSSATTCYDFLFNSNDSSNDNSLGVKAADLQFYYYYNNDDADSQVDWNSLEDQYPNDGYADGLPKKIKIILKTRDEEAREDTQTFETTVFIPGAE